MIGSMVSFLITIRKLVSQELDHVYNSINFGKYTLMIFQICIEIDI